MLPPIICSPNLKLLSHSDQGGRPDGLQIMLEKGHAFIGHREDNGITVLDVRDPRYPHPVAFVASPLGTKSNHIQLHDGLLLAVNTADRTALRDWHARNEAAGGWDPRRADTPAGFAGGLRIYDVSDPTQPRDIGFCPVDGIGLQRIWWVGGRYAYASAHFDEYTDHILAVFDISDPTSPKLAGRWALPGMHRGAGEQPIWPAGKRWALHHMIVAGTLGYGAWRDGGLTIHDLTDPVAPVLLSHRVLSPPFSGGSHTPLPLPGRGLTLLSDEPMSDNCANGISNVWIFDVREPTNPVSFSTLPQPRDADYCARGGRFGAHNLHENCPGLFQSETLIFASWNNAGLRVFDIADAFRPREVGFCVPAAPERVIARGAPRVTQSSDVCVDRNGVVYLTDNNGGLSILQFDGI